MSSGATMNSERYVGILQRFKVNIRRVQPGMYWVFPQHAKATPHMRLQTTAQIHCRGFPVLDYPSHSPDLAPSDFHVFLKLNKYLRRHRSMSINEVKTAVKMWLRQEDPQFYRDGLITRT
jgi:histone-lysine N-methyltransferase SETMAR